MHRRTIRNSVRNWRRNWTIWLNSRNKYPINYPAKIRRCFWTTQTSILNSQPAVSPMLSFPVSVSVQNSHTTHSYDSSVLLSFRGSWHKMLHRKSLRSICVYLMKLVLILFSGISRSSYFSSVWPRMIAQQGTIPSGRLSSFRSSSLSLRNLAAPQIWQEPMPSSVAAIAIFWTRIAAFEKFTLTLLRSVEGMSDETRTTVGAP